MTDDPGIGRNVEELGNAIAEALEADVFSGALDSLKQIEEAARGFRNYMEANGWSENAAEGAAMTWMVTILSGGPRPTCGAE